MTSAAVPASAIALTVSSTSAILVPPLSAWYTASAITGPSISGSQQGRAPGHGLGAAHAAVLGAAAALQPGVLGADARVVEAGGDRVCVEGLALVVLEQVGAHPVQHAR